MKTAVLDEFKQFMDNEAIHELVALYLTRSQEQIDQALHSIKDDDPTALKFALHTLKGGSANIGLAELSALCEQAEKSIDDSMSETIPDQMERIIALHREEKEQLLQYLEGL